MNRLRQTIEAARWYAVGSGIGLLLALPRLLMGGGT